MADKKPNCLMFILILISCTMFIWTASYIQSSQDIQIPTSVSAFNA